MNEHYHTPFEDLLVKHLLGEATPDEVRTVQEWLTASPDNQHFYDQFRLIWERSAPQQEIPPGDITAEEERAWQTLRQRIHQPKTRPFISYGRWASIAAIFLLPLALVALSLWSSHNASTALQKISSGNNLLTDTLPDGSIVQLNRNTELLQPGKFSGAYRNVTMKGEAFFQVSPDKNKPFQVLAGHALITVMGTSFNVQARSDTTRITVESGLIKVANGEHSILVGAGEQITLTADDTMLTKRPSPVSLYKFYRPHELVCNGTPLLQLTAALQEAYDTPIALASPSLNELPVTATFKNDSLDHIVAILCETFDLSAVKKGDSIVLDKK